MTERIVAIGLKIPDNEAYTALVTLQRLGVRVAGVERSVIWNFDDAGEPATFVARVRANEAIFNSNTHRLTVLDGPVPRSGEVWIVRTGEREDSQGAEVKGVADVIRAQRCSAWRLFGPLGVPVERATLALAVERLLCNPAIEKARYP